MKLINTIKSTYINPTQFKGWKFPLGSIVKVRRLKDPLNLKDVKDLELDLVFARVLSFNKDTMRIKTIENDIYSVPYETAQRTKYTRSPKFKSLQQIDTYVKKILDKFAVIAIGQEIYRIEGIYTILYDISQTSNNVVIGSCDGSKREIIFNVPLLQIMDKFDVKDTVLHEMGHALTYYLEPEEHGPLWHKITRAIGGTARETDTVFDLKEEVNRNRALWDKLVADHVEFKTALSDTKYDLIHDKIKQVIDRDIIALHPNEISAQQDWAFGLVKMLITMNNYPMSVIKAERKYLKLVNEGIKILNEILDFYNKERKLRKSDPRVKLVRNIKHEIAEIITG